MRPLEFEILFYDDDAVNLRCLDIDVDLQKDAHVRPMTFYQISAISPHIENGIEYCCIMSNGMDFLCPMRYDRVKRLLDKHVCE